MTCREALEFVVARVNSVPLGGGECRESAYDVTWTKGKKHATVRRPRQPEALEYLIGDTMTRPRLSAADVNPGSAGVVADEIIAYCKAEEPWRGLQPIKGVTCP
jgi:hypothetical protein